MKTHLDTLLETISHAPPTQIDAKIAERVGKLQGANQELIASELKEILDECAHASLASDFGMWVLDHAWRTADMKS